MDRDIILNKSAVIRRCLQRIKEEYASSPSSLQNYTTQDSIILNLLRACEASIDLAMHLIAHKNLGVPQSSRDAFSLLHSHGVISEGVASAMKTMVGFRNIAVHDDQVLNLEIVQAIVEMRLVDFEAFIREIFAEYRHGTMHEEEQG